MTSPFDDLKDLINQFPNADKDAYEAATASLDCRPLGSAGSAPFGVAHLHAWLAAWQGEAAPRAKDIHLCLLASAYRHGAPSDEVVAAIKRASRGRAAVNPLCVRSGLGLRVLELGPEIPHVVNPGEPTWDEGQIMATLAFGMESTAAGGDILGLAGLAPGAEGPARTILSALLALPLDAELEGFDGTDPLLLLRAHGGREMAAILGGLVAARSRRMPVLIEGWSALTAAAVLHALGGPEALDHIQLASLTHQDQAAVATALGLHPVLGCYTDDDAAGMGLALACDIVVSATGLSQMAPLPVS